jgi:E3 ubiquitin-protein ligase CHFR
LVLNNDYYLKHLFQIIASILARPDGFQRLIEEEIFLDLYPNATTLPDADPEAPRQRICRVCASEVFLWGLKGWWHRERMNGHVDPEVMARKDCPDGTSCIEQISTSHARQCKNSIYICVYNLDLK